MDIDPEIGQFISFCFLSQNIEDPVLKWTGEGIVEPQKYFCIGRIGKNSKSRIFRLAFQRISVQADIVQGH